ncbi:MAG: SAM-dependent chlorinase/fluorinase [Chloroflexota bacterium]
MRPFISFLTDFGADSAAAICRGVMLGIAPDAQIVDISHSVRKYAIRDGAFLLWSALRWMPVGVHVAVVDPGVGTARRPIGVLTGRGDILIGPDNGLLMPAADQLGGITAVRELENPDWMLPHRSATFHGRDVFAPVAAHLAIGGRFADVGRALDPASLQMLRFPDATVRDGALETSVRYIDSFGNVRLAGTRQDLTEAVGTLNSGLRLRVEFAPDGDAPPIAEDASWARTFGEIPLGAPLVYEDSFGELAYADNQSSVADRLGIALDRGVRITPA